MIVIDQGGSAAQAQPPMGVGVTPAPHNGNGRRREALILANLPLASRLADLEAKSLPPWIGADEARSVAYLALVQAVDRWDGSRGVPLGAWVRKPIRGAVRDLGRRKAAKLAWVPQEARDTMECFEVSGGEPSPEDVAIRGQSSAAVWDVVDQLPAKLRLIVRLYYVAGLSLPKIGRLLRRDRGDGTGLRVGRMSTMHLEALRMLRGMV